MAGKKQIMDSAEISLSKFLHGDNKHYWVTIGKFLKFMEEHMLSFTHGIY